MTLYGVWRDGNGMTEPVKHVLWPHDIRQAYCGRGVGDGSFTVAKPGDLLDLTMELCQRCYRAMAAAS